MPIDKKLWPFYILKVLHDHAHEGDERDEDGYTYLTRGQIVDFLQTDYGIETQIKAVGDNLTRLYLAAGEEGELGFRLVYLEGERGDDMIRRGWRLEKDTPFEPGEVRMLIDAVIASPLVPEKHLNTLIDHLIPLTEETIVVPKTVREGYNPVQNNVIFYSIEVLNEAIRKRQPVTFELNIIQKDGSLKHKYKKEDGSSHTPVMPEQLLISKGHYYLLATHPDHKEIFKYRIDLMTDVEIAGEGDDISGATEGNLNVVRFREQHSYMMSGKVMKVVIRVRKDSLHTLFDQFGTNVRFVGEDEESYDVELKSALYSVLFWALQYYRSVEVLSPPELRQVLAEAGNTISRMYSCDPGSMRISERQSNDDTLR